tara:strand:- start:4700 stop:5878 length:1179 start_codon:yes stop_codon:yes gene_type:complete
MSHKVSLNRIIGNVVGNLDLENINESIEDFARWSAEAVSKIGSRNSYYRHECLIEVKNYKASLPPNFVSPIAVKYKHQLLSITKRSFRDFSKGAQSNVVQDGTINNNQKITNSVGVPLNIRITFIDVFTSGETISITVTSNDCGKVYSNIYSYIVLPGDTPALIAIAFDNMFQAISNLPYTSVVSGDSIDLIGKSPEINFNIAIAEDSVMGSVEQCVVQQRVPARINTTVTDTSSKHPQFTDNSLANRNVNTLNTGMNATNRSGSYSSYAFGFNDFQAAQVYSIDNGCINFNALDGETLGIAYMGVELDEEGWPMIYHDHEDAVTHYLQYMLISRRYYNGKVPQHVFVNSERRWKDLCAQARGDDEMPTPDELNYLANMWNQLMPLPNKNLF